MDKNIFIKLATNLDNAGLYKESDDLIEIFASNNSLIKTAQSSELDSILSDTEKLTGWSSLIGKSVGTAGVSGLTGFLASYASRQKELRNTYMQNIETDIDPELYNAKTVDQVMINELKQAHQAALGSNKPKTEIEIQLPNNTKPYNPGDPSSYTVQKYKVLNTKEINSKDKSGNTVKKEIKNSIINKFSDPDKYIKDLVIDGVQETIPVKRTERKKIIPKEDLGKFYEQKSKNNFSAMKNALITSGIVTAGAVAYFLLDFQRYKSGLNAKIKAEFNKFSVKYKYSKKTAQDKNNLVQEFTNSLNSLLSRCDGIETIAVASFPRETLRDMVLKIFKKQIGYGTSSSGSPSNTSVQSRPQTTRRRPSAPKPAVKPSSSSEQGGSTGGGGSADL